MCLTSTVQSLFFVENPRLIHFTSPISKGFESIVRDNIFQHLPSINLLRSSQHGFSKTRSCSSFLLDSFHRFVHLRASAASTIIVVYFDFPKAFNQSLIDFFYQQIVVYNIGGKLCSCLQKSLASQLCIALIRGNFNLPCLTWNPSSDQARFDQILETLHVCSFNNL